MNKAAWTVSALLIATAIQGCSGSGSRTYRRQCPDGSWEHYHEEYKWDVDPVTPIQQIIPKRIIIEFGASASDLPAGQFVEYPDGSRAFRPADRPGYEYPITDMEITSTGSGCGIVEDSDPVETITFDYDASTRVTSMLWPINEIPAEAADVPSVHLNRANVSNSSALVTMDREGLGTMMFHTGTVSVTNTYASLTVVRVPILDSSGNLICAIPVLHSVSSIDGVKKSIVVTNW